jgi:hypothetical protein
MGPPWVRQVLEIVRRLLRYDCVAGMSVMGGDRDAVATAEYTVL